MHYAQEQVAVNMCGFDWIQRGNYFRGNPIGRAEVEVKVGKLKNGKVASKYKITGEMIKGGGDRWWIGSRGYVIWSLRLVLCLKIGDLL